jgi:hypothetical protein
VASIGKFKGRAASAALAVLLLTAVPGLAPGQSGDIVQVTERSIKAVYLYKFAGYVQRPDVAPNSTAPITIGVIGASALAEELASVTAGRTVNRRPISVRQLEANESLDDVEILFIGAQERGRLPELLSNASRMPILTVTENEGALRNGSVINFVVSDQRVRFEVSLSAADSSGLKLSSGLLDVAQRVYRGTPE